MFDGNPFEKKKIKCHNLLVKLYLDMTRQFKNILKFIK